MLTRTHPLIVTLMVLALALTATPRASAATPPTQSQEEAIGRTPPRLSYIDGEVSFWRPGADAWASAQLNTPLAPGDEFYTGNRGNLELQVGTRAFVRAWGETQLGLVNQEPDFLQVKVTSGHVALDLRAVDPGRTVELDTPQAAFTIGHPGYYRVDVTPDRSAFITRRGGRATMTPAGLAATAIAPSEEVVLEGMATVTMQSYVAPDPDVWDRWNYARTDELLDAVSARYVPAGVYGVDDLDHYGSWRVVQSYGPVWVPEAAPAGWAPYSTGRWIWDPHYGWTWVDTAPWGWAPYHYGRWVFIDGFWAWTPGPLVVRPVYAPALVAFFAAPGVRVTVGIPFVSWVALGWGEPLVPWWGTVGFVGRPWWGGWGGPRVVNNVVISRTTVVNVNNITVYKNAGSQHAVVAVREEHFGRGAVHEVRLAPVDMRQLKPVHGAIRVKPEPSSFVAAGGRGIHPPKDTLARPVIATRPPAARPAAPPGDGRGGAPAVSVPAPRIVPAPKKTPTSSVQSRPPFGASQAVRQERSRPPLPPQFQGPQRPKDVPATPRESARPSGAAAPAPRDLARPAPTPRKEDQRTTEPQLRGPGKSGGPTSPPQGIEASRPQARQLPGEPANRLFPGRAEGRRGEPGTPPGRGHQGPGEGQPQKRGPEDRGQRQ